VEKKIEILIATTKVATLQLSQDACTIHTQFKILICGFLFVFFFFFFFFVFVLPQPNDILQTLKYTHVIIIDEMSMMTSTILCAIEQRLKQVQGNINPFANVLLLSISDLA
jgi:hypothetical protein